MPLFLASSLEDTDPPPPSPAPRTLCIARSTTNRIRLAAGPGPQMPGSLVPFAPNAPPRSGRPGLPAVTIACAAGLFASRRRCP